MSETISNQNTAQVARKMLAKARKGSDKDADAIDLLKADHDEAQDLFKKYWDAEASSDKELLATELCLALSLHMRLEEDIFYPAVSRALQGAEKSKDKDQLIVPEAKLEHESLKKLISEVESENEAAEFDAHVQVMCEYTNHHVKEEESKMFPRAKDCDLDLDELGRQLKRAKTEMLERLADSTEAAQMPSALFQGSSQSTGLGIADRP